MGLLQQNYHLMRMVESQVEAERSLVNLQEVAS
jgi:hypothetical protein